jgi:uncharacterized protein (PEP-CTERM system associated)
MAKPARTAAAVAASLPLAAPLALLALLASPACRADWKFTPSVALTETYTDNVALTSAEQAKSEFVTDLAPTLSIANDGPRLKLQASYQMHGYAYSDRQVANTNRSQRHLEANAKAKLVEDLLYFDGAASINQQAVSAFGPQVNDNGYASTNRTEIKTYRLSPYLTHRFGSSADMMLRYTRDSVESGNRALGDSKGDSADLSINSGAAFRTIGWGLDYNRQQVDNTVAHESSAETALASLRYRYSPQLSLTANGGYDKYDYQSLGGKTRGKNWSYGLIWTPSLRTSVQASAGKRYFGSTYTLAANHRSRSTVWSVNYNDAVTTTRTQFLLPSTIDTASMLDRLFRASFPDPVARQQAVDAYIRATGLPASLADSINYFSNRYILQKQLQASAAFNGAHSTLVLSVFNTRRSALSLQQTDSALLGSSLSTLNDDTKQLGASALFNLILSSRSAVNLALTSARTESISTGLTDHNRAVRLALTRQLKPKLRGALELRHVQGGNAALGGRTYRENAVSASISMQL